MGQQPKTAERTSRFDGAIEGFLGGLLILLLSYTLRLLGLAAFLPELAVARLVSVTPGPVESFLIGNLGALAKVTAFYSAIAVNQLVYVLLGVAFVRIRSSLPFAEIWKKGLTYFWIPTLATLGILAILTGGQLSDAYGLPTLSIVLVSTIILHLIYAGIVGGVNQFRYSRRHLEGQGPSAEKRGLTRRFFITRGLVGAASLGIILYGLDRLLNQPAPLLFENAPERLKEYLATEVTPNDKFYTVSKNVVDPTVDGAAWKLDVDGTVRTPLSFNLEEVGNLPAVEQFATLTCVSNRIAGPLISTAKWRGIPLANLLQQAGVDPATKHVVFYCADDYSVSIPLEKAMAEGTLLAYEMNGETLPHKHGFPLRAVVPGIYGMMNAKWITRIELTDETHIGYWQKKGWSDTAVIHTSSAIGLPTILESFKEGETVPIAGYSFSGDRGISKVEVSTDEGLTWSNAVLKSPLSDYVWVLWRYDWLPPEAGSFKLLVRATDSKGGVQTAEISAPFPDGATGLHSIDVRIL